METVWVSFVSATISLLVLFGGGFVIIKFLSWRFSKKCKKAFEDVDKHLKALQ